MNRTILARFQLGWFATSIGSSLISPVNLSDSSFFQENLKVLTLPELLSKAISGPPCLLQELPEVYHLLIDKVYAFLDWTTILPFSNAPSSKTTLLFLIFLIHHCNIISGGFQYYSSLL